MSRRSSSARRHRRPGRRRQTRERAATAARGGVASRGGVARRGASPAGTRRRLRAGDGAGASPCGAGAGSRKERARKPTSCKGSGRFSGPKRYKRWVLVRRHGRAGNAGGVSTQIAPQCVSPGFRCGGAPAETHTFSSYGRVPAPIPRRTVCLGEAATRGGIAGRGGIARRGSAPPACTPHVPRPCPRPRVHAAHPRVG